MTWRGKSTILMPLETLAALFVSLMFRHCILTACRSRLFDETTLPPYSPTRITRSSPRNSTAQKFQNPTRPLKKQQSTLESWISPVQDNASPRPNIDRRNGSKSPLEVNARQADRPERSGNDTREDGLRHAPPKSKSSRTPEHNMSPSTVRDIRSPDDGSHQEDDIGRSASEGKTIEELDVREDANAGAEVAAAEDEAMADVVPEVDENSGFIKDPDELEAASMANFRQKDPVVLQPISTAADPQSSPASTNGPGSSNTPVPTPGSPTTSPGDDLPANASHKLPASKEPERRLARSPKSGLEAASEEPPSSIMPDIGDDSFLVEPALADAESHMAMDDGSGSVDKPSRQSDTSTYDQRQPMRIDTKTKNVPDHPVNQTHGMVESPLPMTTVTPRRPTEAPGRPSVERRETRIASGAMERKSVSEILDEAQRSSSHNNRLTLDSPISANTRDSFELATSKARIEERERREKERSKLSTVVFAKPQAEDTMGQEELLRAVSGEVVAKRKEERDYLHTLFESKAYSPPRSVPLNVLIGSAHKALSTDDHLLEYQEQMNCRTLKRIYQLQNAERWSLRQRKRAAEPARPTSHWDFVLDHAKWMHTDFREERKWKLAAAQAAAEWCAEWVASSPEERLELQIEVRPPTLLPAPDAIDDVDMGDEPGPAVSSSPTPDLVPSAEDDSISDGHIEDPRDVVASHAPAAIFSLGASEFNFPIAKTPAAEKLLNELPLYQPTGIEPDMSKSDLAERRDAKWKTDIVGVSRFAKEKLRVQDPKPPSKRSRYEYPSDSPPRRLLIPLQPEQTDVALFMPENKHIRDRIHPGHSFRPPSEHPMPSQAFYESRSSSRWTHAEDDELRKLVKEYSYNWSLISSCMSSKSLFVSGADRRTPWECFERWIALEGLPADMAKTQYFRTYSSRIDSAQRHVAAQQEATQRAAGNNPQNILRKRTNLPVRVERKANQKHLAMLDAMRKLAKKRETALQKQQHAADLAAMRKVNEANQPKVPYHTPAEFSALKLEREVKLAERQEAYRQQMLQSQALQARARAQQIAQGPGAVNGAPRPPGSQGSASAGGAPVNGQPALNNGNQPRPYAPGPNMPPGAMPMGPNSAMVLKQMPPNVQANLQAAALAGRSPEQLMHMQREAARLHQQQMLAVQARQAQANGQHSSPNMANTNMVNGNGAHNAQLAAQYAAVNGMPSPSLGPNGNASSPRTGNGVPFGQALSSGHTPAISAFVADEQARHPEMSQAEVTQRATQRLNSYQKQQMQAAQGGLQNAQQAQRNAMHQAALNAAAGAVNAGAHHANNAYARQQGMMRNEDVQAYNLGRAQMLQQQQQRANAGQMHMPPNGMGMLPGMNGSPVLPIARPVSQHGQMSRSATPRDQRSGSNGLNGQQGSPLMGQPGMQT